ncbi:MAG: cytidylate kinase-like family protein [Lachnospiraceae bacterium]|nr:cytidylate kinase-like family protein [Lachnospiraceae bacterium]
MAKRIIAISRQYGAGGHSLAALLSEKLGIEYYDQDLIKEIAEKSGYSMETVEDQGEQMETGSAFLNVFRSNRFETNKQEQIWDATKTVIRHLADKESCIILGRCANYVLRNREDVISVYLHADPETCAERLYAKTGTKPSEAEMKRVDKRRAAFYQYYTDWEWNDVNGYTISLDTGKISIERCADIIMELFKEDEQ